MPQHAYIDESGTQANQRIMTVALVVLDGARSADRLHNTLSKSIFSDVKIQGHRAKQKFHESQELHYYFIGDVHRQTLGLELAKTSIKAVVAYYTHTEKSASHEHRFRMYQELVKFVIKKAFETHDELVISIGKQGGFEDYGPAFLREVRSTIEAQRSEKFCKGTITLSSASKSGQQIADFYASSSRHYLLAKSGQSTQLGPFERLLHQLVAIEEFLELDAS